MLDDDIGAKAKHDLRDILRLTWWAMCAPLRPCLQGTEAGVDPLLSLRPVQEMRHGRFRFGNDGTSGARYSRLLCNAMWSGTRLKHAQEKSCSLCPHCQKCDESTMHILWECEANLTARIVPSQQWDGSCEPFRFSQLPPCLYICGLVPLGTSLSSVQLALIQVYLSSVLARWDPARFGLSDEDS